MFGQKWLNKWVLLAGFVVLGGILQITGIAKPPITAKPSGVSVAQPCQAASGNIWAGVQLYSDAGCVKPLGKILGIGSKDGKKMVKILHTDGSAAWKTREAVSSQAFVRTDDAALKSPRTVELP